MKDNNVIDFRKVPHFSDLPVKEIRTEYGLTFMGYRRLFILRERNPEEAARIEAIIGEVAEGLVATGLARTS